MDLQLSVFLLFILFAGGHSLRCYECMSWTGSCADQEVTTCPEQCYSLVTVVPLFEGNTTKLKIKGCVPSNLSLYSSYSSADVSSFCCNTDLCNAEDSELSGDSSPDIFNISNVPNPPISNVKKCYHCIGQTCLNIMNCSGNQDHCLKGTVTIPGQTFAVNDCATKATCDAITSVSSVGSFSCCDSNLCNGAQSATMSFTQSSTYNSTQSVNQSSTYNGAQIVNQSSTYNGAQSVNQSFTYNSTQSVNQSSTYNSTQSVNQSSTYNGAQSVNQSPTYNSTQSVNQSSTYNGAQSVNQSSTYNSTQSVNQSSTYNGAQSVNQSSTYNGAQSVNQSSTYNGAQSVNQSSTYNSTQSVNQSSTYNGAQSVNQSSTYNGAQSVNQSSTYNSTQSVTQSFLFLCCSLLSYFLLH